MIEFDEILPPAKYRLSVISIKLHSDLKEEKTNLLADLFRKYFS